ncbi:uncharacterized protein LOC130357399 [Hyla sarda]|uniref:uncharacterized protein LOC130357399 n=1 Tax=Hyla sarda TaxID=327740 RepID=UPI0024C2B78F|nr:uncharacterized protein LOC130357399 [Hyla sarda]
MLNQSALNCSPTCDPQPPNLEEDGVAILEAPGAACPRVPGRDRCVSGGRSRELSGVSQSRGPTEHPSTAKPPAAASSRLPTRQPPPLLLLPPPPLFLLLPPLRPPLLPPRVPGSGSDRDAAPATSYWARGERAEHRPNTEAAARPAGKRSSRGQAPQQPGYSLRSESGHCACVLSAARPDGKGQIFRKLHQSTKRGGLELSWGTVVRSRDLQLLFLLLFLTPLMSSLSKRSLLPRSSEAPLPVTVSQYAILHCAGLYILLVQERS